MPIFAEQDPFDEWVKQRKAISAFGSTAELGGRLRSLQPFKDKLSTVGSVSERFALMFRSYEVEYVHPLLLLQSYSNADKHRSIQVVAARHLDFGNGAALANESRSVGDVTARSKPGMAGGKEWQNAAMIHRGKPYGAWVNPVRELNELRKHLGEVAIPTLVTGFALPRGLPPHLTLGDAEATVSQRVLQGQWDDAIERPRVPTRERFLTAVQRNMNDRKL